MAGKVVAIVRSYRRGATVDRVIETILDAAQEAQEKDAVFERTARSRRTDIALAVNW